MFIVDGGGATPFEPTSPGPLPYGAAEVVVASVGSLRTNRPIFFFGSDVDVASSSSVDDDDDDARVIHRRVGTPRRVPATGIARAADSPRDGAMTTDVIMRLSVSPSGWVVGWFRRVASRVVVCRVS